jgi:carboxyl-terminal processing protease
MMYAALDSVQLNVPEVLIEAYPDKDEVVVVVNDKTQTFSTKDVDSPWRLSGKLKDVFRFIQANMNPGADLAQVEYSAVNGMLSTLDPHSVLLDPESAKEMDISTSGNFGGLGIVIGMRKGKLTVIRPMPDTPAARAGVKKDDRIVRINHESTDHLTLTQAVNRMRGKEGTKVTIWIDRKDEPKEIKYEIVRARIRVESVASKYLDSHNVGYIKVKNFQSSTAREVKSAMKQLRKQGATAWVLDMRYNPGGLLEQAIQVSDLFVDRGTIVTTVGGKERDARRATKKGTDTKAPMAVLVNGQSASASEIVAGALKNLDRAVVVGSTTFGKGSVQILYDNKDGSKLKLTIAEYLTPGDLSIQSIGVPVGATAAQTVKFLYEPRGSQADGDDDGEESNLAMGEPDDTEEIVEDFEVKFARDLVAQARSNKRSRIIKESKRFLARRRSAEQKKMVAALAVLGIDWTAPSRKSESKAQLSASIRLETKDGDEITGGKISAGSTVKVVGTVTNAGTGDASRVHARLKTDDRILDETELAFGKIAPGETRTAHTWIHVPKSALDRVDPLAFEFTEHNGTKVSLAPTKLRVLAQDRPVFSYTHQLLDDGNGDGLVQKGEAMRLLVTIKNTGTGKAHQVTAVLGNKSGGNLDGIVIDRGRFRVEKGMAPGDSKTVEFGFKTNSMFDRDELVLEMSVYDAVLSESVTDKLKWHIHGPSAGPQAANGAVKVLRHGTALREGASIDSPIVGFAKRGTVLSKTGSEGKWVRVELSKGRPAFVASNGVSHSRKKPNSDAFEPHWQVTPPMLALELPALETTGSTYRLRGKATDDSHVEDVYIFVSNRQAKIDNKKVFYKSNRGGDKSDELAFEHEIPLWPGSNFVTIVARENDEVRTTQYMYLYQGPDGAGASTAAR